MTNPSALIIEDDKKLVRIFEHALRTAGFETEIVQSGDAALARLADTTPAIVVLDLHLPNVSGSDILHQIRADDRLTETRVILATADVLMASSLRDEVDIVLVKPISYDLLHDLALSLGKVTAT